MIEVLSFFSILLLSQKTIFPGTKESSFSASCLPLSDNIEEQVLLSLGLIHDLLFSQLTFHILLVQPLASQLFFMLHLINALL